jgi:hypothetical protein
MDAEPSEAITILTALAHACDTLGEGYDPGEPVIMDSLLLYENLDLTTLAARLNPGPATLPDTATSHITTNLNRACLTVALSAVGRQWQSFVAQSLREYRSNRDVEAIQKSLNARLHGVWSTDPRVGRANRLLKPFGLRFSGFTVNREEDDGDFVYATVRTKPLITEIP